MDIHFHLYRRALIACAIVWLALPRPGLAQTITVSSQNTLHLSNNPKWQTKVDTIKAQNGNYSVNLLQEVMKSAELINVRPTSYGLQASGLKGASSYKERYALLFLASQTGNETPMTDYGGKKSFARPPSGTLLTFSTGKKVWFIDFHAIFGKSIGQRRTEAANMADVYTWFRNLQTPTGTTDYIIIAGDWNLGADDIGFTALKGLNLRVTPNEKSSLNQAGVFSEPYDHFVYDPNKFTVTACGLTPLPSGQDNAWYRKKVSDHRGVTCTFTIK